jgi:hypothetical protein
MFPLVLVGGVLEGNKKWDISGEVIKCISKVFPGTDPIWPEVSIPITILVPNFMSLLHTSMLVSGYLRSLRVQKIWDVSLFYIRSHVFFISDLLGMINGICQ